MYELEHCNNRIDDGWKKQDSDEAVYMCTAINHKLGWRNAIDSGACANCDKHDTIEAITNVTLKFALRDYKESAELYRKIYKGSRRRIVQKCLDQSIPTMDIVQNLVYGIMKGVPEQEIRNLVKEFNLVSP